MIVPVLLLTACGGGGSEVDRSFISFDDLIARGTAYENIAISDDDSEEPVPTEFAALPTGTVSYSGIVQVGEQRFDIMIANGGADVDFESTLTYLALGSGTASVDFSTTDLTIEGNNFYEIDDITVFEDDDFDISQLTGTPIEGAITINLQRDVVGENSYAGSVSGSVFKTNGDELNINVPAGGFFTGTNGEAIFVEGFNETDTDSLDDGSYTIESPFGGAGLVRD